MDFRKSVPYLRWFVPACAILFYVYAYLLLDKKDPIDISPEHLTRFFLTFLIATLLVTLSALLFYHLPAWTIFRYIGKQDCQHVIVSLFLASALAATVQWRTFQNGPYWRSLVGVFLLIAFDLVWIYDNAYVERDSPVRGAAAAIVLSQILFLVTTIYQIV